MVQNIGNDSSLNERVSREKTAHTDDDVLENSWQLKQRFRHILTSPTRLRLKQDFDSYINDVAGKRVLEIGCGHGEQALEMLKNGAYVSGIDISDNYITDASSRALQAGFSEKDYEFQTMDAHSLKYADETFDLVVGVGILHHLDLDVSLSEIKRVLKPGGRALFNEPLGANLLLRLFRVLTPKSRTIDEKPLSKSDLKKIEQQWMIQSTYYGVIAAPVAMLTSILLKPYDNNWLLRGADWVEKKINKLQFIQPYNQYVLLNLVRR